MRSPPPAEPETSPKITAMPGWISLPRDACGSDLAFLSGAALARLDLVVGWSAVPEVLWRDRLALSAATACAGFSGRRETTADLRDAVHLLRPGDHPGPGGEILQFWRLAASRPMTTAGLGRALPGLSPERIAALLETGRPGPATRAPGALAAMVLEAALSDRPRAETEALILADATVARGLGWPRLVPLLATGLNTRDLRKQGDDLRQACDRAIVSAARTALQLADGLLRDAAKIRAVTPKLRTRRADQAVALFLNRDVLPASALTGLMSDRAARRFCDRLVDLNALREVTGRDSFRLYGL
ncbi:DUF1403 family protein [Pseudooceanicola algae]|uniref:DUF1403 family protein n=1 Tax=Pseudooceanicola algae TaxID=1537215 RepID=A0A418SBT2_9RHOB|nr:DUF1403 family protein [Pseudooceanicola algae]QPM92530.1 hypothetical protein PSAL_037940 [Pseudooceanicola algae]